MTGEGATDLNCAKSFSQTPSVSCTPSLNKMDAPRALWSLERG